MKTFEFCSKREFSLPETQLVYRDGRVRVCSYDLTTEFLIHSLYDSSLAIRAMDEIVEFGQIFTFESKELQCHARCDMQSQIQFQESSTSDGFVLSLTDIQLDVCFSFRIAENPLVLQTEGGSLLVTRVLMN